MYPLPCLSPPGWAERRKCSARCCSFSCHDFVSDWRPLTVQWLLLQSERAAEKPFVWVPWSDSSADSYYCDFCECRYFIEFWSSGGNDFVAAAIGFCVIWKGFSTESSCEGCSVVRYMAHLNVWMWGLCAKCVSWALCAQCKLGWCHYTLRKWVFSSEPEKGRWCDKWMNEVNTGLIPSEVVLC